MSTSISTSFIKQYSDEVHVAYQRKGSKLRGTVRQANGVKGSTHQFHKYGTGAASQKSAINGNITPMAVAHTNVTATLQDWYAADYVDSLDENKINFDERKLMVDAGAFALGRKTDELIITAAETATTTVAATAGVTLAKLYECFETLASNDVYGTGRVYCFVGPEQWTELLSIDQFSNSDYVGSDNLPFKGEGVTQARVFLDTTFMLHTGLTLTSAVRSCLWYVDNAIGHAVGADIKTDIDWEGIKQAHLVTNSMSQGSVLIDDNGALVFDVTEV